MPIKNLKIGQYLATIWTNVCGLLFDFLPSCPVVSLVWTGRKTGDIRIHRLTLAAVLYYKEDGIAIRSVAGGVNTADSSVHAVVQYRRKQSTRSRSTTPECGRNIDTAGSDGTADRPTRAPTFPTGQTADALQLIRVWLVQQGPKKFHKSWLRLSLVMSWPPSWIWSNRK